MEERDDRPRAALCTLGCRVNQYESEAIEAELCALGFAIADFSEKCDVYIINTCAVTGESERKSRQMIRRAAAINPHAYVLVTGCYSQLHPAEAEALAGVFYVCGNRNKLSCAQMAERLVREGAAANAASSLCDVTSAPLEPMFLRKGARARVFVKIEDGCDNHCTYCIIRAARGTVVSRPADEIMKEICSLTQNGCREVILTGIEAAAYGRDGTGDSLGALTKRVAALDAVARVRIGSLDPAALTDEFCDALASSPKIMPSFHLSLQSGSNRILAAMKRRYNRAQVLRQVAYLRTVKPGVTFSCDMIVGFPGESEADFADTMDMARQIDFLHIHAFPFSPREGTPAAAMPAQIPEDVKRARLRTLVSLGDELTARQYAAAVGTEKSILVESRKGRNLLGHTAEMMEISVKSTEDCIGELRQVRVIGYDGKKLLADLIGKD